MQAWNHFVVFFSLHGNCFTDKLVLNVSMSPAIVVYDLSLIQGIWEGRIRKHKKQQRKERERQEKSALAK